MNKLLPINIAILTFFLSGCDKTPREEKKLDNSPTVQTQVASEVKPKNEVAPAAPSMSYEPLYVSDTGVGFDNIFTIGPLGGDAMGNALNYQSKAGVTNVMEQVVQDAQTIGYLKVEHAYKFGNKYVLVVSTGENGNSCPATTYAFTYDSKIESVTSKTTVEGCSVIVEALADGNKLTVKKEDKPTIIYNGEVK